MKWLKRLVINLINRFRIIKDLNNFRIVSETFYKRYNSCIPSRKIKEDKFNHLWETGIVYNRECLDRIVEEAIKRRQSNEKYKYLHKVIEYNSQDKVKDLIKKLKQIIFYYE